MALVDKTVILTIEEETWMKFRIYVLKSGKTIAGLFVEDVHRILADAAFDEEGDGNDQSR